LLCDGLLFAFVVTGRVALQFCELQRLIRWGVEVSVAWYFCAETRNLLKRGVVAAILPGKSTADPRSGSTGPGGRA